MNIFKSHIIARLPSELFPQQARGFWHILHLVREIWKQRTRHPHYLWRPPVPGLQTCAAAKNKDPRSAGSDNKIECQDPRSVGSRAKTH